MELSFVHVWNEDIQWGERTNKFQFIFIDWAVVVTICVEVFHFPNSRNTLHSRERSGAVKMVEMKISPYIYDYSEYIWYIYVQWHPYCVHYKICHISYLSYLILVIFIFYVSIQDEERHLILNIKWATTSRPPDLTMHGLYAGKHTRTRLSCFYFSLAGPVQFISYKHLLMWFDSPITLADRFVRK